MKYFIYDNIDDIK